MPGCHSTAVFESLPQASQITSKTTYSRGSIVRRGTRKMQPYHSRSFRRHSRPPTGIGVRFEAESFRLEFETTVKLYTCSGKKSKVAERRYDSCQVCLEVSGWPKRNWRCRWIVLRAAITPHLQLMASRRVQDYNVWPGLEEWETDCLMCWENDCLSIWMILFVSIQNLQRLIMTCQTWSTS
jgi:hypothetical protein